MSPKSRGDLVKQLYNVGSADLGKIFCNLCFACFN